MGSIGSTVFSLLLISVLAEPEWWKHMSMYQIYPRSFKDSDGDGIGDLKGIQSKLQHLVDSKFDAFWLSPIYQSPMKDFGYDISDFKAIDPIFGTMNDFDDLVKEAHRKNLKVIMDFVPNHTSDQHEWFQKSIKKIEPYTDYYVWHEGKIINGTRHPPNNWISIFHNPSWTWNEERQAWYYHCFLPEQPDLNYHNENVVKDIKDVLRFWLDKGVDGFRVDAIEDLVEDKYFRDEPLTGLTNDPLNLTYVHRHHTANLYENYDMVNQWQEVLNEYDSRILTLEIYFQLNHTMFTNYYNTAAAFPNNNDFTDLLYSTANAKKFKNVLDFWIKNNIPEGKVLSWGGGNHDRHRLCSLYGSGFGQAVQIMIHLLPGVAITYYGEEIGMENMWYSWEDTRDPQGLLMGPEKYETSSRDKARAPFPWDNSTSAGFSDNSKPWLPIDKNYRTINLATQKQANSSYYKSFLRITSLRELPAVKEGSLWLEVLPENIIAFSREMKNEKSVFVLVNFENRSQIVKLDDYRNIPAELELYHTTSPCEIKLGERVKSNALHVPARGATIFITAYT